MAGSPARGVAILLSTYNGERFLRAQLRSILEQHDRDWTLYWRDDGSIDGTLCIQREFVAECGPERVKVVPFGQRVGVAPSYFALIQAAVAEGAGLLAFADQDDIWLPEKLGRARRALARVASGIPALYCARQLLTDIRLRPI